MNYLLLYSQKTYLFIDVSTSNLTHLLTYYTASFMSLQVRLD